MARTLPRLVPERSVAAFQDVWDGITPYVLAMVVRTAGPTAAKAGSRAIVSSGGDLVGFIGGGCVRKAVVAAGLKALAERKPLLIRVVPKQRLNEEQEKPGVAVFPSSCPSKGEADIFLEPVIPRPRLLVFGEGELAERLLLLAGVAGFEPAFCNAEPHPFDDIANRIAPVDLLQPRRRVSQFAVVATQGAGDRPAILSALAACGGPILFVASRAKAAHMLQALKDGGTAEDDLARIVSPAGLDIGAIDPGEVTISILAEVIRLRRKSPCGQGEGTA